MQNAYRNQTGPGAGAFVIVALLAFAVVFAIGFLRPSSSQVSIYDRIQQLAWQFKNIEGRDFSIRNLNPWKRGVPSIVARPIPAPVEPPEDRTYKVVSGDTLSRIAQRFEMTPAQLAARNDLSDPDLLDVGQTLRIPGTAASETTTASADEKPAPTPKAVAAARPVATPAAPVALPSVSSAPPAAVSGAPVDALIGMAEEELSAARFDHALHTTEAIERLLLAAPASEASATAKRRARMELVRATAYAAVGHTQQVQNALTKALAADPTLELDPATTSPKLLAALEVARQLQADEAATATSE